VMLTCRCGHDGNGQHPCHAMEYTCRKPATQRFYNARPAALTGAHVKLTTTETWACDECWAAMTRLLEEHRAQKERNDV
jgi:hypothetical protein